MGDQAMPLRDEDIQRIAEYVKPWLRELVGTIAPQPAVAGIDAKLFERMVRVEEELKSQREIMDGRFHSMDKRFEDLIGHVDRRFEAVDKRFEDLIGHVDKRFEAVDKRFEDVDKRFEDLIGHMDKRFEAVDKRFALITWLIGIGLATGVAAIGILLGT